MELSRDDSDARSCTFPVELGASQLSVVRELMSE